MRITLQKHGGQAAGMRRPPLSLEVASFGEDTATTLSRLVESAVQSSPMASSTRPAPDEMSYTITIDDGEKVRVLRQSDTSMTPAFATLLDWLEQHFSSK
ncbi:MAG: hypothetical protein M3361_20440 [Candidatus Tectomicrobia bacterium]|nr:hypothetical protein [Candidatus Tectomicrobia bacterium]